MIIASLAAVHDSDDESDASNVSESTGVDNNQKEEDAIFIRNLPSTIKFNEIFDVFSKSGRIKVCLTLVSNTRHFRFPLFVLEILCTERTKQMKT
jgi:RNA recognition motif-containing protein